MLKHACQRPLAACWCQRDVRGALKIRQNIDRTTMPNKKSQRAPKWRPRGSTNQQQRLSVEVQKRCPSKKLNKSNTRPPQPQNQRSRTVAKSLNSGVCKKPHPRLQNTSKTLPNIGKKVSPGWYRNINNQVITDNCKSTPKCSQLEPQKSQSEKQKHPWACMLGCPSVRRHAFVSKRHPADGGGHSPKHAPEEQTRRTNN